MDSPLLVDTTVMGKWMLAMGTDYLQDASHYARTPGTAWRDTPTDLVAPVLTSLAQRPLQTWRGCMDY